MLRPYETDCFASLATTLNKGTNSYNSNNSKWIHHHHLSVSGGLSMNHLFSEPLKKAECAEDAEVETQNYTEAHRIHRKAWIRPYCVLRNFLCPLFLLCDRQIANHQSNITNHISIIILSIPVNQQIASLRSQRHLTKVPISITATIASESSLSPFLPPPSLIVAKITQLSWILIIFTCIQILRIIILICGRLRNHTINQ